MIPALAAISSSQQLALPYPQLTDVEFCAFVAQAEPGDALVYYVGHLGHDRMKVAKVHPLPERRRIGKLASVAMTLAEDGFVHLVQRRIAIGMWAYIAVRSKKRLPAERSKALLEAACAANPSDNGDCNVTS